MLVRKGLVNPFAATKSSENPVLSAQASSMPVHTQLRPLVPMKASDVKPSYKKKSSDEELLDLKELETIEVVDNSACNILDIHARILEYFNYVSKKVQLLERSKTMLAELIKTSREPQTIKDYTLQMASVSSKIQFLSASSPLDYLISTEAIINEFKKGVQNSGIVVMGKSKNLSDLRTDTFRHNIISSYLSIAVRFCPILKVDKNTKLHCCDRCGDVLEDAGEYYRCTYCNVMKESYEITSDKTDMSKVSIKKTGPDDIVQNFIAIIAQYDLTSTTKIPDTVISSIQHAISEYRSFDINSMTKEDLVRIMSAVKINSAWFKHLNKIHFLLTGKKPQSIAQYVPNLIKRCEYFAEIYDEVKDEDRSNFIHGLHVLWLFLKNEGADTPRDDFTLLKSRDVEISNIRTFRKAFDILRVSHPEFNWVIFEFE